MDDDNDKNGEIQNPIPARPVTPVRQRREKASIDIHDTPAERIAYQHTVLCQTCLPYKDPGDAVRVWERRQGAVFLSLEAGRVYDRASQRLVDVGLPYGSRPRLILAHLNREAILNDSPRIEVESTLTGFIKRIVGRSPNARETRDFKDQLSRLVATTIRMAVDLPDDRAYQANTHIVELLELWDGKDGRQRVLWPAVIELSHGYYKTLRRHAVPLDERALAALANSPMALDVYSWLAQRLCRIRPKRQQFVSWAALQDQFGTGYGRIRDFRKQFRAILTEVHAQYLGAKFEVDERGMTLLYSLPPIPGHHLDLIKDD